MNQILLYCKGHTEQMWAATIVSILLDCDFRDSALAIEKYFEIKDKLYD